MPDNQPTRSSPLVLSQDVLAEIKPSEDFLGAQEFLYAAMHDDQDYLIGRYREVESPLSHSVNLGRNLGKPLEWDVKKKRALAKRIDSWPQSAAVWGREFLKNPVAAVKKTELTGKQLLGLVWSHETLAKFVSTAGALEADIDQAHRLKWLESGLQMAISTADKEKESIWRLSWGDEWQLWRAKCLDASKSTYSEETRKFLAPYDAANFNFLGQKTLLAGEIKPGDEDIWTTPSGKVISGHFLSLWTDGINGLSAEAHQDNNVGNQALRAPVRLWLLGNEDCRLAFEEDVWQACATANQTDPVHGCWEDLLLENLVSYVLQPHCAGDFAEEAVLRLKEVQARSVFRGFYDKKKLFPFLGYVAASASKLMLREYEEFANSMTSPTLQAYWLGTSGRLGSADKQCVLEEVMNGQHWQSWRDYKLQVSRDVGPNPGKACLMSLAFLSLLQSDWLALDLAKNHVENSRLPELAKNASNALEAACAWQLAFVLKEVNPAWLQVAWPELHSSKSALDWLTVQAVQNAALHKQAAVLVHAKMRIESVAGAKAVISGSGVKPRL